MNLNNWRNWWTNALIRLGFRDQYAHAFAEQDYFVEDTEEEVSLAPTFLEWKFKIGKNWNKPGRWFGGGGGSKYRAPSVDVGAIKRQAAAEATKAAQAVAAKNQAAYDKQAAEIKKMKEAEAKRQREKQAKLTSSASSLRIGGPERKLGQEKRSKQDRKFGTTKTRKPLNKKTLLAQQAPGGVGYSGGQPVL